MFNRIPPQSTFSIGKLIGGLSKTLNVANQVIPLYKEAKPMIQNARNAFSLIKEFTNTTTTKVINNTEKNMQPIKEKVELIKSTSTNITTNNDIQNKNKKGPTFFL